MREREYIRFAKACFCACDFNICNSVKRFEKAIKKKNNKKKNNNTFLKLTPLIIELTHDTFARFSASFYKQVHFCDSLFAFLHYKSLLQRGILCSGVGVVGGNLGVILVRVCELVFQNLPHSYTWPLKKRTHSYT